MKKQTCIFFTAAIIVASFTTFAQNAIGFGSPTTKNSELITKNSLKGSGMLFTPNKGQIADREGNLHPEILYKGDGGGADVYLRKTGVSYVTSNMGEVMREINKEVEIKKYDLSFSQAQAEELKHELEEKAIVKIQRTDVDFVGGNPNPQTLNYEEVEGYTNYYYAHCPNGITNVKSYNRVVQKNIYTGIDVIYYGGKQSGLKYDIVVNPGANPNDIKLNYTGAKVRLNGSKLIVQSELGETVETLPKVYQNINGKIVDVGCKYKLAISDQRLGNREKTPPPNGYSQLANHYIVTFELGTYNFELPLIIDPYWATYYGGTNNDYGCSTACDNAGNVYLAGYTLSVNAIASATGHKTVSVGGDAFLAQFNAATGARNWATYYGDDAGWDYGYSTSCDNAGNVYLAGETQSTNSIATATAHQSVYGGGTWDAFLVQFSTATGVRNWGSYYGSIGRDHGYSTSCDNTGNVYLTGRTTSTNAIATATVHQPTYGGGSYDAFLVKFNVAGTRSWGTYYGGTNYDYGASTTCDNAGNVYLSGYTQSTNAIAAASAHQPGNGGGLYDAYLVQFNAATGARNWGTYYGGAAADYGYSTACDNAGNVYLAGPTESTNAITTATAHQPGYGGGLSNAFLVQFNTTSGVRNWGTYYGSGVGENTAKDKAIAIDIKNNLYLYMEEEDAPGPNLDACSYQPNSAGGVEDQMIVKFNPAGKKICATYFGGTGYEDLDMGGAIAISGNTLFICASNGPGLYPGALGGGYPVTPGSWQSVHGNTSSGDAVLASLCINICEAKTLALAYTANTTSVCTNAPVKFTPAVNNACDTTGYKFHWVFTGGTPAVSDSVSPTVKFSGAGSYDVKLVVTTLCKKDSITKTNYITVNSCGSPPSITTTGSIICPGTCATVTSTATGGSGAYTYSWNTGETTQNINPCPVTTTTYTVTVTDAGGNTSTSTAVVTANPAVTVTATSTNITCSGTSTGSVTATPGAGTPGFTYTWSNGGTTSQISNLTSQIYTVTVVDSKGCTAVSTTTINSPPALLGQFTKGTANCSDCGCKEWIMLNATGGTAPYSYTWSDGYDKRYKNALCPGVYNVIVTDGNGCKATVKVNAP